MQTRLQFGSDQGPGDIRGDVAGSRDVREPQPEQKSNQGVKIINDEPLGKKEQDLVWTEDGWASNMQEVPRFGSAGLVHLTYCGHFCHMPYHSPGGWLWRGLWQQPRRNTRLWFLFEWCPFALESVLCDLPNYLLWLLCMSSLFLPTSVWPLKIGWIIRGRKRHEGHIHRVQMACLEQIPEPLHRAAVHIITLLSKLLFCFLPLLLLLTYFWSILVTLNMK